MLYSLPPLARVNGSDTETLMHNTISLRAITKVAQWLSGSTGGKQSNSFTLNTESLSNNHILYVFSLLFEIISVVLQTHGNK